MSELVHIEDAAKIRLQARETQLIFSSVGNFLLLPCCYLEGTGYRAFDSS